MALARKGSRRIVVDGAVYRWRIRQKPAQVEGAGPAPVSYAVEREDAPAAVLVVKAPCPPPAGRMGWAALTAQEAQIADAVRTALDSGWAPLRQGTPFHLDLSRDLAAA